MRGHDWYIPPEACENCGEPLPSDCEAIEYRFPTGTHVVWTCGSDRCRAEVLEDPRE